MCRSNFRYIHRGQYAGGADRYAEVHFGSANLYQSEIDRNFGFLREAIGSGNLNRLRRYCYFGAARHERAA